MVKVAFVGWRGLVGSVLLERMKQEKDFSHAEFSFFSSSSPGREAPKVDNVKAHNLKDAYSISELFSFDIIMSCQGSDYTIKTHAELRDKGWQGYWLDAASFLRMKEQSTLILDPVNSDNIIKALTHGKKDFIGANCTVSLMMLGIHGLFKENLLEWVHSSSYQAISGAGSKAINELFEDIKQAGKTILEKESSKANILEKIDSIHHSLNQLSPKENSSRLATNVLPWIDSLIQNGKTREEAKGAEETNKILDSKNFIPIDGTCVRVPVLRSHSQNLTLKLNKKIPQEELELILKKANPWVKLIPNNKKETLQYLTPQATSCTLDILIGRARKLDLPGNIYEVFTVGDQLLWGAAEPLRRTLILLLDFLKNKS